MVSPEQVHGLPSTPDELRSSARSRIVTDAGGDDESDASRDRLSDINQAISSQGRPQARGRTPADSTECCDNACKRLQELHGYKGDFGASAAVAPKARCVKHARSPYESAFRLDQLMQERTGVVRISAPPQFVAASNQQPLPYLGPTRACK